MPEETRTPINERRSISSHTLTDHGVYDDEPFPTEGNAYHWYQRAVYWKREAHRNEGQQATMDFDKSSGNGFSFSFMSSGDTAIVRNLIFKQQQIQAIKHVRTVTTMSLIEAKNLCDKMKSEMGWNGKYNDECKFSSNWS